MTIAVRLQSRHGTFELDAAFEGPGRGITSIFGHSGSGKTTLLRALAGLEQAHGTIVVNGEVWLDSDKAVSVSTHLRAIGYVFQEASLFPHLSVRENLEYGFKRVAAAERRISFEQVVELLGVAPLLVRSPGRLSGGERQRVAMARALLTSPRLLLMDEPLAALDETSKLEIIPYLERLHDELAMPVVLVSHSLREVARLADFMVWLEGGRVRGAGPLTEMLGRVAMVQAEEEAGAVVDAVVASHDAHFHLTALDSVGGRLWVPRINAAPGAPVRVRLPARDMSLGLEAEEKSSILNAWRARVEEIATVGPGQVMVRLGAGPNCDVQLLARITAKSADHLRLAPGLMVFARIKSVALLE